LRLGPLVPDIRLDSPGARLPHFLGGGLLAVLSPAPASPSEAPAHEIHHAVPRCLLRLRDDADNSDLDGAGIQAWLEFEHECIRWGVDVEIAREDLQELVVRSTVVMEREKHRFLHARDFKRWGRRGGLATLRRYGSGWYSALARKRWGKISAEDLEAARPLR